MARRSYRAPSALPVIDGFSAVFSPWSAGVPSLGVATSAAAVAASFVCANLAAFMTRIATRCTCKASANYPSPNIIDPKAARAFFRAVCFCKLLDTADPAYWRSLARTGDLDAPPKRALSVDQGSSSSSAFCSVPRTA